MRILVTGGAGYIGSHCCKYLSQQGHEPIVLDNLSMGHEKAVRWGPLAKVDLRDRDGVLNVFKEYRPEAVVHFAACSFVGESMQDPGKYFANNTVGSQNLLDALVAHDVHDIVFSSTCATYGEPDTMPISEQTPQHPVNPYGQSKLMVEEMLAWYGQIHGLRWAALRYFNVAGADPDAEIGEEHDPESHLIPLAIWAAQGKRDQLSVFGTDYPTPDGTAIRDYIHVWDLVQAHLLALDFLQADSGPLQANLGTGNGHSVRQVIDTVGAVTGLEVPSLDTDRRAGDPPELVADARRATQQLQWTPQRSDLPTMVEDAWAWFRQQS
ncbi:MAG: UDP-glucose 4-epimerase GalE [Gemmatimonadetes bacterium]|nr:UDP-glucose 4-epimerase GalE [Gemmatimonadota bacterium]MBT4609689.1 UDP-glucose 4-epimerase GalE [Gemmatimonadota bacterium]MBT5056202.1 UDP-glucose 4-epimerase GalE [Gemmatimonadota bacterium]MBT5591266.1 UDP-glucose 4-epimerase GalE [Gemmatimonadota bacterium]MBT5962279.1 UDP-glucose 4-epimerase GalE [Gemmatimonadota bacterium]